jgi:hypothetical protein
MLAAGAQHVEAFNAQLRKLTLSLANRFPDDADIWRTKERVITVTATTPFAAVDVVGPYLLGHEAAICDSTVAEFAAALQTSDFDDEISSVNEGDAENTRYAQELVAKLRSEAGRMSAEDLRGYQKCLHALIDAYVDWKAAKLGIR